MSKWEAALEDFARCADRLAAEVERIPEQGLDRALDEKSWSVRQIIHHLADAALIWSMFYRQALGDNRGAFPLGWYWSKTQDEWSEIWHYSVRGIQSSLDLYRACNQSALELLRPAALGRSLAKISASPGGEIW